MMEKENRFYFFTYYVLHISTCLNTCCMLEANSSTHCQLFLASPGTGTLKGWKICFPGVVVAGESVVGGRCPHISSFSYGYLGRFFANLSPWSSTLSSTCLFSAAVCLWPLIIISNSSLHTVSFGASSLPVRQFSRIELQDALMSYLLWTPLSSKVK